ncbi:MAG: hypothetical protein HOP28_04460 [Gemmatimonadales bacterium]|nr:hypothetical protein [Gemmatimonadales bacterium]
MRTILGAALALAISSPQLPAGEEILRATHAKYGGKWFQTLTFVQKTTFGDGRVETWYESLQLPGRLRIDYAPASGGRAILFRNDSIYAYAAGTLQAPRPRVHPLLVMLYDLHTQAPEITIAKVKGLGFDLTRAHRTSWRGDSVVVVGALEGDTTSRQFWLDARRMVTVRLIDPTPQGRQDIHIGGYAAVGSWWHERDVKVYVNGTLALHEEYTDVRIDAPLEPSVFDPASKHTAPRWVGEGAPRW